MRRVWLEEPAYWVAVMLVFAGLTHVAMVLALPYRSPSDAYAEVSAAASGVFFKTVQRRAADQPPYQDAAMATAACLVDLRQGAVAVDLAVEAAGFAVLSVHDRHGRVLSGLTNRSASQQKLSIVILTAAQAAHRPVRTEAGAPPEIRVETDDLDNFVLAQSLATQPSERHAAETGVAGLSCRPAGD